MLHTFLFFGVVCFLSYILKLFLSCQMEYRKKITPFYTIITVKNNEDCIEGIVCSIIKAFEKSTGFSCCQIMLVDINSSDSTCLIAERLAKRYPFVTLFNFEELKALNKHSQDKSPCDISIFNIGTENNGWHDKHELQKSFSIKSHFFHNYFPFNNFVYFETFCFVILNFFIIIAHFCFVVNNFLKFFIKFETFSCNFRKNVLE